MQPKPTFTGRPRRRKAHPWVKASDAFARFLITMGGIGTIAAVLMVGVFLVAVAMPLFGSARVGSGHWADVPHDPARLAAIGSDESGAVGWLLDGSGVTLFKTADGGRLAGKTASEIGLDGASAIRVQPGTMQAVVGFEKGSFRSGRIGIDSEFVAVADLDAVLRKLGPGEATMDGDAVVVRGANDRHARLRFVTDLAAEPDRVLDSPVLDVDVTQLSDGPLAAALDQRGRVRVEAISSRRNLLTDEVVSTSSGATIEPESRRPGAGQATEAGGPRRPRFVRVSDLGDQVFVIDADGLSRRYEIRTIENPVLMEEFDVAPGEPDVAAVTRLFGGKSLAVADTKGTVRVFFATRAADATASDGLRMVAAKTFPPKSPGDAGAVTAIAASPRSRLFAVADAGGGIRLLQATGGTTVLELSNADGAAEPSADMILITPRENRILAADARRVAAWPFDAGYPEVSLDSLFGRLWYENYPRPVHAWETTGHESFESKFGLVPLVFGTLKATCFSMLFATPIALLAAIYSSQFMHPRWRARVKPTIEMMASLPSVVLGFIAGLILAPFVESRVMTVIAGCFTVPLTLLTGAHLWQLLPTEWRNALAAARFFVISLVALPLGAMLARSVGPLMERLLFQGDFRGWLDGREGSGLGGWMLAMLPLSAIAAAVLCGRLVNPWLRQASVGWSRRRAGLTSLATFAAGLGLTVVFAVAAAVFLDALRFDTRGGIFDTYVQRNAMIVAIGMSFAIIPLIFTIADDALSSVPEHLRSASLGAGATPWQTATRVIIPAATSGLFSAVMIGLGRAVGETMIVLMAAGNTPLMGWNLFNGFQTLSAAIATELPEAARGTAHYRVLFLAALVLFAITFVVNTAAEIVRQRFRRRSYEL